MPLPADVKRNLATALASEDPDELRQWLAVHELGYNQFDGVVTAVITRGREDQLRLLLPCWPQGPSSDFVGTAVFLAAMDASPTIQRLVLPRSHSPARVIDRYLERARKQGVDARAAANTCLTCLWPHVSATTRLDWAEDPAFEHVPVVHAWSLHLQLIDAIISLAPAAVERCLAAGVDPTIDNHAALFAAIQRDQVAITRTLLDHCPGPVTEPDLILSTFGADPAIQAMIFARTDRLAALKAFFQCPDVRDGYDQLMEVLMEGVAQIWPHLEDAERADWAQRPGLRRVPQVHAWKQIRDRLVVLDNHPVPPPSRRRQRV